MWRTCLWNDRTERARHFLLDALCTGTTAFLPNVAKSARRHAAGPGQSQSRAVNVGTFLSYPVPLKMYPVQGKGTKEQKSMKCSMHPPFLFSFIFSYY